MPNWCENTLIVSGEPADLARFKEFAKGNDELLDANCFIPYPKEYALLDKISPLRILDDLPEAQRKTEELAETEIPDAVMLTLKGYDLTRDGYNQGGYDWCIQNWGTKGNLYRVELEEELRLLTYQFQTAWSPPSPVICKMGEMFPELLFELEYKDESMGFQGQLEIRNGEVNNV